MGATDWDEPQRTLADAIAALDAGDRSRFATLYAALLPIIDQLPVDGVELWLQAADDWSAAGKWSTLLEARLPRCAEDLADPRVRLLIALAYAQTCATDAQNNKLAGAVQRLAQARGTLEPLIAETGA